MHAIYRQNFGFTDIIIGRKHADAPFDDKGEIVKLVFILGTPKSKPGDYLAVVSALCKLLRDANDRTAMLAAPTLALSGVRSSAAPLASILSPWPVFWVSSIAVFLVSLDTTMLYAAFGAMRVIQLASVKLPAPGMACATTVGAPGMCLPRWRATRRPK